MESYEENFLKERPQGLCKMCGKCCRTAINRKYTYKESRLMAFRGDEYAKEFLKMFTPYNSVEEARNAAPDVVDKILEELDENEILREEVTFYKCKYLLDNNMCSIYEERPSICVHYPQNAWTITPPGCGYTTWLYLKQEEYKEKVRKAKEEYLELQLMKKKTTDEVVLKKISSVENKINNTIYQFAEYGANNW